jgi:hypothetical protein
LATGELRSAGAGNYLNWGSFLTLAIDQNNPSTLYATTSPKTGTQLFKSTDGGASWVNTGFPNSFRAAELGLIRKPRGCGYRQGVYPP